MRKNITAFTEIYTEGYPAYISVNSEDNGMYSIVVRSRANMSSAMIEVSKETLELLTNDIINSI